MTDNKNNNGIPDRVRVDARDPAEVEYLQQKFPGIQHGEVLTAIREAGPVRKDVIRYIEKQYLKTTGKG